MENTSIKNTLKVKYTLVADKNGLFNTIFCDTERERADFAAKYLQYGYRVKFRNDTVDPDIEYEEKEYDKNKK